MEYGHIYTMGFWQSDTVQVIKRNKQNQHKGKRIIDGTDRGLCAEGKQTQISIFKRTHRVNYRSVTGMYKAFLRLWNFFYFFTCNFFHGLSIFFHNY